MTLFQRDQQAYDRQLPLDDKPRELPTLGACPYCRTNLTVDATGKWCVRCHSRGDLGTYPIEELYDCTLDEEANRKRYQEGEKR
jgi:uncharacterized protein YbaR (Trm112 family)